MEAKVKKPLRYETVFRVVLLCSFLQSSYQISRAFWILYYDMHHHPLKYFQVFICLKRCVISISRFSSSLGNIKMLQVRKSLLLENHNQHILLWWTDTRKVYLTIFGIHLFSPRRWCFLLVVILIGWRSIEKRLHLWKNIPTRKWRCTSLEICLFKKFLWKVLFFKQSSF